ncbi:hypothetical protein B0H19DRAFT_1069432 [Mycena capillaripes]|nr:hypothetical protein B0H19DRAFT_1069432 [Mycena capillaripes]
MEALRDIPGFFLALALALLLDCILSAPEALTGPQVRTSVRDRLKYKSKDESKGVDFKNYNNTFGCTKVKGGHIMCGECARATRTGWAAQRTQNCAREMRGAAEKAGSVAWAGREVAYAVMPVPQEQGARRVNGGQAQCYGSKKTKLAEFSDIAKLEEKKRQREIELAQLRTRQAMSTMDVKGWLAEKREDRRHLERKGKQDEKMAKLRLKELKMVHVHELRVVAVRTESASASTSHAASFVDSRSRESASHYSSSEPADYGDFDAFGSIPASDHRFGGDAAGPLSSGLDAEYSQYNHLGNPFDKGPMYGAGHLAAATKN